MPDQPIASKSTSGAPNLGSSHFEPIGPDRARVTLKLAYDPQGFAESAGDAPGVVSRRIEVTLRAFRSFVEGRGAETGARRHAAHQGQTPVPGTGAAA